MFSDLFSILAQQIVFWVGNFWQLYCRKSPPAASCHAQNIARIVNAVHQCHFDCNVWRFSIARNVNNFSFKTLTQLVSQSVSDIVTYWAKKMTIFVLSYFGKDSDDIFFPSFQSGSAVFGKKVDIPAVGRGQTLVLGELPNHSMPSHNFGRNQRISRQKYFSRLLLLCLLETIMTKWLINHNGGRYLQNNNREFHTESKTNDCSSRDICHA